MTTMIEVKTADLIGPALDWAAGYAFGGCPVRCAGDLPRWKFTTLEASVWGDDRYLGDIERWQPTVDWAQGGPLLDRYKVGTVPMDVGLAAGSGPHWFATAFFNGESYDTCHKGEGPSALIAACRAIVGLVLGDVVSVPAELVQGSTQ